MVVFDYVLNKLLNKWDEMFYCEGEELFILFFSLKIDLYLSNDF